MDTLSNQSFSAFIGIDCPDMEHDGWYFRNSTIRIAISR
jgi:hypothetical protein